MMRVNLLNRGELQLAVWSCRRIVELVEIHEKGKMFFLKCNGRSVFTYKLDFQRFNKIRTLKSVLSASAELNVLNSMLTLFSGPFTLSAVTHLAKNVIFQ